MPGMQVSGQEAADYMASPSGQMLEQEYQAGQAEAMRQMANRGQGLVNPQSPFGGPQPAGGGFSAPGGAQEMQRIYGLMAEHAEDPTRVMEQYVQSTQKQQELDRRNQPIEQFLQLYGKVNPYDWSAGSLQRFHDNYIKTGQLQFDLLEPKQTLTSEENKAILEADEKMYSSRGLIGRIGSMVDRLDVAARTGDYKQGILGTADEWISQNITGDVRDTELLKQEYRGLKNSKVIQDLPPGVASDRDIAIAREAWPGPNVSPAYLAAFMRGVRKLQVIEYAYNAHRSHYIGMERNVAGISKDWEMNKGKWVADAMANNGLEVYDPRNEDGTPMDWNQAADFWYAREGVGQQPSVVRAAPAAAPQPGARGTRQVPQAPGPAAEPQVSPERRSEILKQYGL